MIKMHLQISTSDSSLASIFICHCESSSLSAPSPMAMAASLSFSTPQPLPTRISPRSNLNSLRLFSHASHLRLDRAVRARNASLRLNIQCVTQPKGTFLPQDFIALLLYFRCMFSGFGMFLQPPAEKEGVIAGFTPS